MNIKVTGNENGDIINIGGNESGEIIDGGDLKAMAEARTPPGDPSVDGKSFSFESSKYAPGLQSIPPPNISHNLIIGSHGNTKHENNWRRFGIKYESNGETI